MILVFKDFLSGFAFYMIHLGFQLKMRFKNSVLKKTNQTNNSVVFCNKKLKDNISCFAFETFSLR